MKKLLIGLLSLGCFLSYADTQDLNLEIQERVNRIQKLESSLSEAVKELSFLLSLEQRGVSHENSYAYSPSLYTLVNRSIKEILKENSQREISQALVAVDQALGGREIKIKTHQGKTVISSNCDEVYKRNEAFLKKKVLELCMNQGRSCESELSTIQFSNSGDHTNNNGRVQRRYCRTEATLKY